ncbi:MAG: glutaredoxin-like protein NrdH [Microbacterium sp.]|uniref:glutaredoxin-like protein NrdH n=1 Tax=Microbacterium sp. TaxID=51671 RepID=UPI001ACAF236|nr:glutaredoxin-like protein NrdH [Microbacterium sp.]MBN9214106.1 glutaredoxin-like protein NrdH [Microbacterium sp.]
MQLCPLVWSKPSCVQCNATYRALDSKGIDYEIHDLTEHPDALDTLRNANFLQAPVVQFREDLWTGFRPDKIDEIAKAIA